MAKFHINNNGEAKACHAKVRCRFGGASGHENHFPSLAAAEKASQEQLEKVYGNINGAVKKSNLSPAAKTALAKLHSDGMQVQHVESIAAGDLSTPSSTVSDVTVLDERPYQELLTSIRRGDFRGTW